MNIWMNSKSFWPFRQRKRISHDPILPLASSLFYFNSSTRVCIWKERRWIETHCQCLYFLSTNHLHQRTLLLYQAISFAVLFLLYCVLYCCTCVYIVAPMMSSMRFINVGRRTRIFSFRRISPIPFHWTMNFWFSSSSRLIACISLSYNFKRVEIKWGNITFPIWTVSSWSRKKEINICIMRWMLSLLYVDSYWMTL